MKNLDALFKSIANIKSKYDIEREKDSFNIINALHDMYDERRLHSRLISYLLSPVSGHKMDTLYLKLFLRHVLNLEEFATTNVTVLPDEANKSEYENIDILIINDNDQAIIIENKIRASDSNHPKCSKDGYKGQLERYYNIIREGKDQNDRSIAHKRDEVWIYYLSTEGKEPSVDSVGILKDEDNSWNESHILSYDEHIRAWLEICINITSNDNVRILIDHYLKLINKMTNNDLSKDERLELKRTVGNDTESVKYLLENFKHIKWHTVGEFWNYLKERLVSVGYQNVGFYFKEENEVDNITVDFKNAVLLVTHRFQNIKHCVLFDSKKDKRVYISGLRDLTWGLISSTVRYKTI